MIAQKQTYIPTVSSVPVDEYPSFTSFITDPIEFKDSTKDWSIDVTLPGDPTGASMSVLVCNTQDGTYILYKTLSTHIDLSVAQNCAIFDSIMPFRYMKLQYDYGTSDTKVSIKMSI